MTRHRLPNNANFGPRLRQLLSRLVDGDWIVVQSDQQRREVKAVAGRVRPDWLGFVDVADDAVVDPRRFDR